MDMSQLLNYMQARSSIMRVRRGDLGYGAWEKREWMSSDGRHLVSLRRRLKESVPALRGEMNNILLCKLDDLRSRLNTTLIKAVKNRTGHQDC